MKRIYHSQSDRVVAGVCGGFAEYINVNQVPELLVWIFLILVGVCAGTVESIAVNSTIMGLFFASGMAITMTAIILPRIDAR